MLLWECVPKGVLQLPNIRPSLLARLLLTRSGIPTLQKGVENAAKYLPIWGIPPPPVQVHKTGRRQSLQPYGWPLTITDAASAIVFL